MSGVAPDVSSGHAKGFGETPKPTRETRVLPLQTRLWRMSRVMEIAKKSGWKFCRRRERHISPRRDIEISLGRCSLHLHNGLSLRPAFFEISQRVLGSIERKYLVNHRPDDPRLEKFADLRKLASVGMNE